MGAHSKSSNPPSTLPPPSRRSVAPVALGLCGLAACAPIPKQYAVRPAALASALDGNVRPLRIAPPMAVVHEQDSVVRVVSDAHTCSGVLVDEDLVLTAHHCVVQRSKELAYQPPSAFSVELGGDHLPWGDVKVKAVVAPQCGASGGGGDVAVLVLAHALVGVPTARVRFEKDPQIGEMIDPVGFGRCATSEGIRRRVRDGGRVRSLTYETLHTFASICPGDSGGPVFRRGSNEVLGVVSLAEMDGDETTRGQAVIARVDAYRDLLANARMIGDGAATAAELPPVSCERAGQ